MAERLNTFAALLTALLLWPVSAQAAPPANAPAAGEEIVVTGVREPERAAAEFVQAVSLDHEGQIARFETSVCPALFGLPEDQKAMVEARLRDVAETAGVEVERPGCRPNLIVVIAADGADFVRTLRRKRPWLFRDLKRGEVERLTAAQSAGRAWHLIEWREADGRRMEHFVDTRGDYPEAHLTPNHQFSRLSKPARPALTLAFVVLDLPSVVELTLPQLADYAAMRTLAMTRAGTPAAGGRSVLGLFDDLRQDRTPAASLTAWDLAYLKALYATESRTTMAQQRATMARIAGRELAGRAGEAPSEP